MIGMLFSLALAAATPETPKAPMSPQAAPVATGAKLEAPERYRMTLGAEAGHFNDWEKYDLARFAGFQGVVGVSNIRGKPSDTWASVARVNLIGAGDEKSRPVVALVLQFDRKTRKPLAFLTRTGSDKSEALQVALPADKPIRFGVKVHRQGKMLVALQGERFEVDLPFEVKGISVVASGLDAVFEPFELFRLAP